jgi:hypothetical protein
MNNKKYGGIFFAGKFIGTLYVMSAIGWAPSALSETCWKDAYGRGQGAIPGVCGPDQEKSDPLCYSKCKDGFIALGSTCRQPCPPDFKEFDSGESKFCIPPQYSLSLRDTYPIGDEEKCKGEHPDLGCEKIKTRRLEAGAGPPGRLVWEEKWIPRCKPGYTGHLSHDFICARDCPKNMPAPNPAQYYFCQRSSYPREAVSPGCEAGREHDAGLCYDACKPGYKGLGSVLGTMSSR